MITLPEKGSAIWNCLRVRDPVIRKQLLENIEKYPKGYGNEDRGYKTIAWAIVWDKTPQGRDYWIKITNQYRDNPSLWSDEPIWETLIPDKYYIKNHQYSGTNTELAKLLQLIQDKERWNGSAEYYKIENGQVSNNSTGYKNLPQVDYNLWKLYVEQKYGKPIEREKVTPREELAVKYPIGTRVKIVYAGKGAINCNGKYGILTEDTNKAGVLKESPGINIKVDDGNVWRVNPDAILEPDTRTETPEPWSILTTDGVRVYEGDKVSWLDKGGRSHNTRDCKITPEYQRSIDSGYLPFSTYEAAEEYRKKQCGEVPEELHAGDWVEVLDTEKVKWFCDGNKVIGTRLQINADMAKSWKSNYAAADPNGKCVNYRREDVKKVDGPHLVVSDRKWQVGSMFKSKYNGEVYTIDHPTEYPDGNEYRVYSSEDGIEDEWYTAGELDDNYNNGAWIPYQEQPIPVEERNVYGAFNLLTNNNNQSDQITNNQKQQQNGNSKQEISSKESSSTYNGSIIKEEVQPETIISGNTTKGKAITVSQYAESICGGQRSNGTAIRC